MICFTNESDMKGTHKIVYFCLVTLEHVRLLRSRSSSKAGLPATLVSLCSIMDSSTHVYT